MVNDDLRVSDGSVELRVSYHVDLRRVERDGSVGSSVGGAEGEERRIVGPRGTKDRGEAERDFCRCGCLVV